MAAVEEGGGESRTEIGERSVAVGDNNASFAAHVAEGFIMGTGDNMTAIAAHDTEFGWW